MGRGGTECRDITPLVRTVAEHLKRRGVIGPDDGRLVTALRNVDTEGRQVPAQFWGADIEVGRHFANEVVAEQSQHQARHFFRGR